MKKKGIFLFAYFAFLCVGIIYLIHENEKKEFVNVELKYNVSNDTIVIFKDSLHKYKYYKIIVQGTANE